MKVLIDLSPQACELLEQSSMTAEEIIYSFLDIDPPQKTTSFIVVESYKGVAVVSFKGLNDCFYSFAPGHQSFSGVSYTLDSSQQIIKDVIDRVINSRGLSRSEVLLSNNLLETLSIAETEPSKDTISALSICLCSALETKKDTDTLNGCLWLSCKLSEGWQLPPKTKTWVRSKIITLPQASCHVENKISSRFGKLMRLADD